MRAIPSFFYHLLSFPYRALRWMMLTRPIRFTRFGTFYILFSLAVGAAAINTGNNLLYLILGILLGFIIISGFLSDSALWGITTDWQPMGSLYAGEKTMLECRIRKGWFPGVAVTITSHWKSLPSLLSFAPWIPARASASVRVPLTPEHRGYLTLERCHYATRFPFGLFQKSHTERLDQQWVVYPHLKHLPWDFLQRQGQDSSAESSTRIGVGSVPFVLRDYRTGDTMRQMDWKMTAKRQRLIVKEMEEEASEGDLLVLNAWPPFRGSDDMEDFISFVASLVFCIYENRRPVGLVTPERAFKPESSRQHLHRIFEFLALVDPAQSRGTEAYTLSVMNAAQAIDIISLWKSYGRR